MSLVRAGASPRGRRDARRRCQTAGTLPSGSGLPRPSETTVSGASAPPPRGVGTVRTPAAGDDPQRRRDALPSAGGPPGAVHRLNGDGCREAPKR